MHPEGATATLAEALRAVPLDDLPQRFLCTWGKWVDGYSDDADDLIAALVVDVRAALAAAARAHLGLTGSPPAADAGESAEAKYLREVVQGALEEPDWISRAVLSGLNGYVAEHGGAVTKANSVSVVKRLMGELKAAVRDRFDLDKQPRYSPYDREKAGYVCRKCAQQGRARCDHAVKVLRTRLESLWSAALDASDALTCGKCGPHAERAIAALREVLDAEREFRAPAPERSEGDR
jgi:hypothetical protein